MREAVMAAVGSDWTATRDVVVATLPPGPRLSWRKRKAHRAAVVVVLQELRAEGHLERRFCGEEGDGWSEWRPLDGATDGRYAGAATPIP